MIKRDFIMYELGINIDLITLLKYSRDELKKIDNSILFENQGVKFERIIHKALVDTKNRLDIQNITEIELVSGKKFPDIIIHTHKCLFGVEVKTSRSGGWDTLGGSIFESTKVEGVDTIAIFFANFSGRRPDYRFKYMEDCISDITITHKPRYVINMEINQEETIFDKTGTTYVQLSNSSNPFRLVRNYMKEKSGDLWWIDDDEAEGYSYKKNIQGIRPWNELVPADKESLILDIVVLFPVVFSQNKNYNNIATYLVTKRGVVNPSLRDQFSSGGKYYNSGYCYPKYLQRLFNTAFIDKLVHKLDAPNINEIVEYIDNIDVTNYKNIWLETVIEHINKHNNTNISMDAKKYLIDLLQELM